MSDDAKSDRKKAPQRAPERERAASPAPATMASKSAPVAMSNSGVLSMLSARREQDLHGGRPLDPRLRTDMEERFGTSLEDVRVHTDARAGEIAGRQNARAYTLGSDIVFGASEYAPNTARGRRLIGHELAHVVQQQLGGGAGGAIDHDAAESEADRAADREEPIQIAVAAPAGVQRQSLNYTPKTAQVGASFAGPTAHVTVNGVEIAAGTTGDQDKFAVDSKQDGATGHLKIAIRIWPGGNMSFLASARATLDMAATSYDAWILEHAIHYKNSDDSTGVEGWEPKADIHKAAPPLPKTPVPKKPPPQPKKVEPKDPEPEDKPAVYDPLHDDPSPYKHVDYSPSQQMQQALEDRDLKRAAELASQLADSDLEALTPVERSLVLWGLALNPSNDALDMNQIDRIFNATPDDGLNELQHALTSGNGQLLQELRAHAKGDDVARLESAVAGLTARRLSSGQSMLDFSMADALEPPPIVLPDEAKAPTWVGGQPDWAKNMKVWTDPRGNWNFYDPEHGLTTMDMLGKTKNSNSMFGSEYIDRMKTGFKNDEELRYTGGLHYVKGKGLLTEEQWQNHLSQNFLQGSSDSNRKVENLAGGVKAWNDTQGGVASFFAHTFGGVSSDEPQKILDDTKFGVNFNLAQIGKARTSSDLDKTLGHLDFATKSGSALLNEHENKVIGGGETTIFVIKVTAAGAVVVATAGYAAGAAPVAFGLKGAGMAVGGGMVFSTGRQVVRLAEGSQSEFSFKEVAVGGGAGLLLYAAPVLLVPASGYGMYNSLGEAEKGHYGTFAFDMLAPIAGAGAAKLPSMKFTPGGRFTRFVMPYMLSATMRGAAEIPGFSGRAYAPSIPNGPEIVMVMPSQGARAPAPFEIATPDVAPNVAPNPNAFISPTVNPNLGTGSPYNFPIIINLAPTTAPSSAAEAGPKSVADAYNTNAPTVTSNPIDFGIGSALRPNVASTGEVKPYWQFGRKNGAGGADYLDPAVVPFAGLSKPSLLTTDEHIHPTKGVQAFLPTWSKGGAPALRWPLSVARLKTQIDLKLIQDVKDGKITPSQFIKESRANIWRAWQRAKANGDVVPTEQEVSKAISDFEAKLRPEMDAAGLPTNDW